MIPPLKPVHFSTTKRLDPPPNLIPYHTSADRRRGKKRKRYIERETRNEYTQMSRTFRK